MSAPEPAALDFIPHTAVANRLTRNFPVSPIELQFIFELEDDEIASLEIRS